MVQRERPIRAVFVTYAFGSTASQSAVIGVLKRFLRLVRSLPPGEVEYHWIHAGFLPDADPLVAEWLPRLSRYSTWGDRVQTPADGTPPWAAHLLLAAHRFAARLQKRVLHGPLSEREGIRRLFSRLQPAIVVMVENPLAGYMQMVSEVAEELGLPQVAVDNYMEPTHPPVLFASSPAMERWFLLGLPYQGEMGWLSEKVMLAPPLLAPAPPPLGEPADVTIFGYDPKVAADGMGFLARLPAGTVGRLLGPPLSAAEQADLAARAGGAKVIFAPLPHDADFRAFVQTSRLVICKNGFQQIVECLALGTPTIVSEGDGVPSCFLCDEILRFCRFLPAQPELWEDALALARSWLAARPAMPWVAALAAIPDPSRHAAGLFLEFLRRAVAEPLPAARERVHAAGNA